MKTKSPVCHDAEYVILPSQEIGVLQTLSKNLDIKNIKKTPGKNLLKFAFNGEVMPSVHNGSFIFAFIFLL